MKQFKKGEISRGKAEFLAKSSEFYAMKNHLKSRTCFDDCL